MNRFIHYAIFVAGLATVVWVGAGYIGNHPLALAMTALIGVFYVVGALELKRFHEATESLSRAVSDMPAPPPSLGPWLEPLHPSLRNAVRLRIEGERIGLPGPALTPYLAGLLVLLGMLGTFLGMVVTLNGTGAALQSATDLDAVRASLSAPVRGLGLAFGTSVAGVAASAMLGLLSALLRRERLQAGQLLDTRIATGLRVFSQAHRRDESFALLQRQAEAMPALADRLQLMMDTMERQTQALNERLAAGQDRFHDKADAAYVALAASVDRSLKDSLSDSARAASAAIQPVVEATMAGIARETATLHGTVAQAMQAQLDQLSGRFERSSDGVAQLWQTTLAEQQRAGEATARELQAALARFAETFEQRSATLVDAVATRLDTTVDRLADGWQGAIAEHARSSQQLSGDTQQALVAAVAGFERHSASLLESLGTAHGELQSALASRDETRLAAWTESLAAMAAQLQTEWQQAGASTTRQQEEITRALAQTAHDMSSQAEAHARATIAEITTLVQAAAEAPRAAAEVIAELRQKLSDSMVRDNAMLEERTRILDTLGTLLDAVNHASTEQRAAIDALVSASADVLERVGTRFTDQVGADTGRLASVAAQVTGSAVEVASLGEAFGGSVQQFNDASDKLGAQLQRIEAALGQSMARSDEQLAYYVAQAREVIDLSILSQRQIVENLQQLAAERGAQGSNA